MPLEGTIVYVYKQVHVYQFMFNTDTTTYRMHVCFCP